MIELRALSLQIARSRVLERGAPKLQVMPSRVGG
jgi:hypothetical protein